MRLLTSFAHTSVELSKLSSKELSRLLEVSTDFSIGIAPDFSQALSGIKSIALDYKKIGNELSFQLLIPDVVSSLTSAARFGPTGSECVSPS